MVGRNGSLHAQCSGTNGASDPRTYRGDKRLNEQDPGRWLGKRRENLFERSSRSDVSPTLLQIKILEEAGIGNRQTASAYLKELEKVGVLRGAKKGRETLLYQ